MIDIHSHMLPMVDDGADSVKMALLLLDEAYKNGTKKVVLTPHFAEARKFINPKEKIRPLYQDLCHIVRQNRIPIQLYLGTEYLYRSKMRLKENFLDLQTMNDTKYLLTEFPFHCEEKLILEAVEEIVEKGMIPIIAHPERYECMQINPGFYRTIKRKGGLLQMNKGSVLGQHGTYAKEAAFELLANKAYSFVGSDAHNLRRDSKTIQGIRLYRENF